MCSLNVTRPSVDACARGPGVPADSHTTAVSTAVLVRIGRSGRRMGSPLLSAGCGTSGSGRNEAADRLGDWSSDDAARQHRVDRLTQIVDGDDAARFAEFFVAVVDSA